VTYMSEPKTRYDFNLLLPPAPGNGKQTRFRGENVSREFTSAAIQVFANEVLARRREQAQQPKREE